MKLKSEQYEYIKQTVVDTFEYYGIKCIPINCFEMAYKMGIKIRPYSAFDTKLKERALKYSTDGFSCLKDGTWYIVYNDEKENYGRMNNTLMHEIGHFALGHTDLSGEEEEAEAKFFAKYALAPPPLIHTVHNNLKVQITPTIIKDMFYISDEAAHIAYSYYQKWLKYGTKNPSEYDVKLIQLIEHQVKSYIQ